MANLKDDAIDKHVENFNYATALIKVIILLLGFGLFMFSRSAFIFFAAAIIPSILVICSDKVNHKCASATICTFNLIGVLPYLRELWTMSSLNEGARELMSNPLAWLVIYSTSFLGFMVYIMLPGIISQFYVAKANVRILNLIEHRNRICSDWDIKLEENKEAVKSSDGM